MAEEKQPKGPKPKKDSSSSNPQVSTRQPLIKQTGSNTSPGPAPPCPGTTISLLIIERLRNSGISGFFGNLRFVIAQYKELVLLGRNGVIAHEENRYGWLYIKKRLFDAGVVLDSFLLKFDAKAYDVLLNLVFGRNSANIGKPSVLGAIVVCLLSMKPLRGMIYAISDSHVDFLSQKATMDITSLIRDQAEKSSIDTSANLMLKYLKTDKNPHGSNEKKTVASGAIEKMIYSRVGKYPAACCGLN